MVLICGTKGIDLANQSLPFATEKWHFAVKSDKNNGENNDFSRFKAFFLCF